MPNWSSNHTAFIGPKTALDNIASTITPDGEFDFNRLAPTPEVLEACGAPIHVLSDEEFATEYNLEQAPTTIDDFRAFANDFSLATDAYNGRPPTLQDMPATVHRVIKDTYGHSDWYDWRAANWGSKWTGSGAETTRYHDNLLLVTYETAWNPPEGVFATLRSTYKGLHIINGAVIEGFADDIDVKESDLTAFLTYFSAESSVETEFSDPDADAAETEVLLWHYLTCAVNEENIEMLIDKGVLVGEDGETVCIDSLG